MDLMEMDLMEMDLVSLFFYWILKNFLYGHPQFIDPWSFKANFNLASANSILPLTTETGIQIILTSHDSNPMANNHVIIELYGGKYTAIVPPTQTPIQQFVLRLGYYVFNFVMDFALSIIIEMILIELNI
jgi:hypothetical protein